MKPTAKPRSSNIAKDNNEVSESEPQPTQAPDAALKYRKQHKQRLSFMPWLYWTLKPEQRAWAAVWQKEWQSYLQEMETVKIQGDCFISPDAHLFAERGRSITIGEGSFIAANSVLHGPLEIGQHVGINHHVSIDGGRSGVHIGDHCRIAAHCSLYAFNHGMTKSKLIRQQKVTSKGIRLCNDVWLGAHTGVVDGVTIGEGCIVGMQSVVTHDLPAYTVAAGSPAIKIRERT